MKTMLPSYQSSTARRLTAACAALALAAVGHADPTINIEAGSASGKVSPTFYGLMTEEINHSYDGGLYAELIQNRSFLDDASTPAHWSAVGGANISLDHAQPPNANVPVSLKVEAASAQGGVANEGYWGIPITADTSYRVSFYARGDSGFTGPITASLQSDDGATTYATQDVPSITGAWAQYSVTLKTATVEPTAKARFALTLGKAGTVWLSCVSVFPPTANDQANGFRKDILQMMVDMHPKFLRFPGGNYLEGDEINLHFDWKKTLGPIAQRPGHQGPWSYRSTDGMGIAEFLMWCEDMHAEPLLAVYAGYSLKGAHVKPGKDLEPYVQDALDEIEYLIGPTTSQWGAQRARDGHPAPFSNLHYIEIGNEDFFDKSGTYDARFTQIYDAIKSHYPQLLCIATIGNDQPAKLRVHSRRPDAVDEHFYLSSAEFVKKSQQYYDRYPRTGPKIFVGEWAAFEDVKPWSPESKGLPPTPSMKSAIGDATWMAGMERNSDIIVMNCYAPLLVNVNPGAYQWRPDMIGYNALTSFGSPSYYAFQMFSQNIGDEILKVTPAGTTVQTAATRDSRTHEVFLKLVNPDATDAPVTINFNGTGLVAPTGTAITLAADPSATNSIDDPKKVVPVTTQVTGVKSSFSYTVPAHGIVVLKVKAG